MFSTTLSWKACSVRKGAHSFFSCHSVTVEIIDGTFKSVDKLLEAQRHREVPCFAPDAVKWCF